MSASEKKKKKRDASSGGLINYLVVIDVVVICHRWCKSDVPLLSHGLSGCETTRHFAFYPIRRYWEFLRSRFNRAYPFLPTIRDFVLSATACSVQIFGTEREIIPSREMLRTQSLRRRMLCAIHRKRVRQRVGERER